jgi:hypothetical protein
MPNSYTISSGGALPMAAALAQGVQAGVQSYQNQKYKQAELAMKQQQMDSEAELRRMQMQKLQQEMAPMTFEAAKLQTLLDAQEAGMKVPGSVMTDQWQTVMGHLDNPRKLQAANQFIQQKQASMTGQMSPDQFSEMFGSDARSAAPQPLQPQQMSAPQQMSNPQPSGASRDPAGDYNPNVFSPSTGMRLQASPQAQPQDQSGRVTFANPKEAEFYGNLVKSTRQAQLGQGQLAARGDQTLASLLSNLNATSAKIQNSQDSNEAKVHIAELEGQIKTYKANLEAQTKKTVAGIGAKARTDSASIRGSGKGAVKNPDLALVDDQIKQNSKMMDSLAKPASGFSMELPNEIAAKKATLAEKSQKLIQLRGLVQSGKSYSDAAAALGIAPAASAVPSDVIPQAKSAAPAKAPKNAGAAAFTRDMPGVVDKLKSLPEGSAFTLDGEKYQIKGGAPVPAQ